MQYSFIDSIGHKQHYLHTTLWTFTVLHFDNIGYLHHLQHLTFIAFTFTTLNIYNIIYKTHSLHYLQHSLLSIIYNFGHLQLCAFTTLDSYNTVPNTAHHSHPSISMRRACKRSCRVCQESGHAGAQQPTPPVYLFCQSVSQSVSGPASHLYGGSSDDELVSPSSV